MMYHKTWQPIEGMDGTLLYPILNKANYITSNTFIFQTPETIMVIDPGSLADQVATVRRVIGEALQKCPRPVLVYLTHCHMDHSFEFLSNIPDISIHAPVFVAIQENGLLAFKQKDRELTGAGRYKTAIPDARMDICLLSDEEIRFDIRKQLLLTADLQLNITTSTQKTSGGNQLARQEIFINGRAIQVYFTPGHSPDSISFQIGKLLLVGDCLFAADHLIAGLPGWNRNDALTSAENLIWLIEKENISLIGQGHGDSLTPEKAIEKLKKMICKLQTITVEKELNLQTLLASSQHAIDVSKEANEIMSGMAESLRHVLYYLEYLEESEEASKFSTTFDSKKLAQVFSLFNEMVDDMNSGKLLEGGLVLRSAVLFSNMKALFHAEGLDLIAGQRLMARLERLLDDFIEDSGGREVKKSLSVFQAGEFLNEIIGALQTDIHADNSIFDVLDEDHAFLKSLVQRIAYKSVFKNIAFDIAGQQDALIETDRTRLAEVIEIIAELMVEQGSMKIAFDVSTSGQTITIAIDVGLIPIFLLSDCYQKRSLIRRLNWIDGCFGLKTRGASTIILLTLPLRNLIEGL